MLLFPIHFLEHNRADCCDRCFLEWLSLRLVNVYRENPNLGFLHRLREVASRSGRV
jgi:hypothetical protein